eukprot:1328134-Rhodomonas_salina.1
MRGMLTSRSHVTRGHVTLSPPPSPSPTPKKQPPLRALLRSTSSRLPLRAPTLPHSRRSPPLPSSERVTWDTVVAMSIR